MSDETFLFSTRSVAGKRVAIAGASGMLGQALGRFLKGQGYEVVRFVRRAAREEGEIAWHPERGELDPAAFEGVDAVVNLAGANVGERRWTKARREEIRASRVDSTRTIVKAMERAGRKPKVFVCASATGFYSERGDEELTENAPGGVGFLAEVCRAWETEALAAERFGVRTACVRFGVVLTPDGGALAKLLPLFRLGLGGKMGSGRQWMSWVALDDAVGAIEHTMRARACRGPVNVVAPEPVTNAEFTAALARVLRRPAVCAVPTWALRAVLGEMADETILASLRAVPEKLPGTGFEFRHPTLRGALERMLGRGI